MARKTAAAPDFVGAVTLPGTFEYFDVTDHDFSEFHVAADGVRYPALRTVAIYDSEGMAIGRYDAGLDNEPLVFDFLEASAIGGGIIYRLSNPDSEGNYHYLFVGHACEHSVEGEFEISQPENEPEEPEEVVEETSARGRSGRVSARAEREVAKKDTIRYDDIPEDEPSDEELGLPKKDPGRPSIEKVEARRALRAEALAEYYAEQEKKNSRGSGRGTGRTVRTVRDEPEEAPEPAPRSGRGVAKATPARSSFRR